jgi:hypothetical protein
MDPVCTGECTLHLADYKSGWMLFTQPKTTILKKEKLLLVCINFYERFKMRIALRLTFTIKNFRENNKLISPDCNGNPLAFSRKIGM